MESKAMGVAAAALILGLVSFVNMVIIDEKLEEHLKPEPELVEGGLCRDVGQMYFDQENGKTYICIGGEPEWKDIDEAWERLGEIEGFPALENRPAE